MTVIHTRIYRVVIVLVFIALAVKPGKCDVEVEEATEDLVEDGRNADVVEKKLEHLNAAARQDDDSVEWKNDNKNRDTRKKKNSDDDLALPIWAIVLITMACFLFLLCCCCCCCAMMQLDNEDKRRGYENRKHSVREFVIVLIPGKREQIYRDYEARQATRNGAPQQQQQQQSAVAEPKQDTPLLGPNQTNEGAPATTPATAPGTTPAAASAPAAVPPRVGGQELKKTH